MAKRVPCAGCKSPIHDISSALIQPHPMFPSLKVLFCLGCVSQTLEEHKAPLQRTDSGLSIKTPPNRDDCYHCGKAYDVDDRSESAFCSATCEYLNRSYRPDRGAPRPSAAPCDCADYEDCGWCTMVEGLLPAKGRVPTPYPDDASPLVLCKN